jgi:hypothetical protein
MSKLRLAKITMFLAVASATVQAQTYTVLYNFGSKSGDPTDPRFSGIIAQSRSGSLFSTADDHWTDGLGTAFKITPRGTLTVLHHFNGADGQASVGASLWAVTEIITAPRNPGATLGTEPFSRYQRRGT